MSPGQAEGHPVDARREYRRALELDPDSPQAHWTYGYYFLRPLGHLDEALVHLKRAVELEPLMHHFGAALADLHKHRREYDLAIERFQSLIEMEPDSYIAHWLLGSTYSLIGMFQEAVSEVERAAALAGPLPLVIGTLGAAHAMAGRERHARQVIAELEVRAAHAYIPPGAFACIYTALNEPDNAFDWLEKAIEARDPTAVWLSTDPAFDTLRPDPRYKALLRKMKLE